MNTTTTTTTEPLQWSTDWTAIMERILATYPITNGPDGLYHVRDPNGGRGYHTPTRAAAVAQALEWFVENLNEVSKRAS